LWEREGDVELIKIIARFVDGRVMKGFVHDFLPNKPSFHMYPPPDSPASQQAVEVAVDDLKAVYFVRDFVGDPKYQERKEFFDGEKPPQGRKVEVTFKDGEVLVGSTLSYDRHRSGFFIFPVDPQVNNIRVFAVLKSVAKVRFF
jgi:hypothetical protein